VLVGGLAMAGGLAVAPSVATGESTTATLTSPLAGASSTTFTWSYQFNDNGGHELSNIAIGLCSTDILAHVVSASPSGETFTSGDVPGGHTAFGPGIKFDTTAVTGTLTVVFDQAYTAGGIMRIQSHSGDGDDGDLVTEAVGPGTCGATPTTAPGSTTTTVASTTTTAPATTTTTVPVTTTTVPVTTTTLPVTTTTVLVTTTVPATTTTVPVTTTIPATTTTIRATTTTAAPTTTTTVAPTTSTSVPTSVLGNRFVNDDPAADLAGTGFNGAPLVAFGAVCMALGAVLLASGRLQLARG
jgi:hypothetical protein